MDYIMIADDDDDDDAMIESDDKNTNAGCAAAAAASASSSTTPARARAANDLELWRKAKAGTHMRVCGKQCWPTQASCLKEDKAGLPGSFQPCRLFPIPGNDTDCSVHYKASSL